MRRDAQLQRMGGFQGVRISSVTKPRGSAWAEPLGPFVIRRSAGLHVYPGIFMLMLLNAAPQPSAKTPMWAPPMEWEMREESALVSST